MNRKGIKVLLFDKDIYQKPYLDTLTSKELYEFALADDENNTTNLIYPIYFTSTTLSSIHMIIHLGARLNSLY